MVVYFDKANYINYIKTANDSDNGKDSLRMIKKQLDLHLNFDINNLDEYEIILLEEFQDGVSEEFIFTQGSDKINRPLTKDSFPSKDGIYLLDDEAGVNKIKTIKTVLIGSLNEEVETLIKVIIGNDYSFHKLKTIGVEITPDNHLDIFSLPFSYLAVVDRYVFKGPETGGNLGLFTYNLDKILKKIYDAKMGFSHLFFIYQVKVNVDKAHPKYDEGPDLEKLKDKIKKVTHKHCPSPEIYFIGVPDGYIDDEHDRYLLSNYVYIKSGDSFIYFSSNGDIKTNSNSVDFYSLAFREYRVKNKLLIDKLNSISEVVLNKHNKFSKTPNGINNSQIIQI